MFRRAVDAIKHWREHSGTVICGTEQALRPVVEELERRNLQHRLLPGNIAFHSAAMDPLQEDAFAALAFLNDCAFDAAVPFVSSVTGAHTERLDNAYWWTNIRQRVRFAAALDTAVRDFRPDVVLEIAPHSALQSGEYAHGPLIGHRVPCDHLLFEARMSERDFPWLAEHRVHHASNVPLRLTDIDTTGFEPYFYVGDSDFYERIDASLGETFQYGPYFRNIQRVLWEDTTANYLFDVEMDEQLWLDGREEGYVANPALLDGGLQIFLYHLLRATDIFAMPRRAVGVTFLHPPTGPRLTCYVKKDPDWADINEQGQFTQRRGERPGAASASTTATPASWCCVSTPTSRHRGAGAHPLRRVPQPRRRRALRCPGLARGAGAGAGRRPAAPARRRDPAAAR